MPDLEGFHKKFHTEQIDKFHGHSFINFTVKIQKIALEKELCQMMYCIELI